jgi:hypothetical protein
VFKYTCSSCDTEFIILNNEDCDDEINCPICLSEIEDEGVKLKKVEYEVE